MNLSRARNPRCLVGEQLCYALSLFYSAALCRVSECAITGCWDCAMLCYAMLCCRLPHVAVL